MDTISFLFHSLVNFTQISSALTEHCTGCLFGITAPARPLGAALTPSPNACTLSCTILPLELCGGTGPNYSVYGRVTVSRRSFSPCVQSCLLQLFSKSFVISFVVLSAKRAFHEEGCGILIWRRPRSLHSGLDVCLSFTYGRHRLLLTLTARLNLHTPTTVPDTATLNLRFPLCVRISPFKGDASTFPATRSQQNATLTYQKYRCPKPQRQRPRSRQE